jgi:hypothetical protein
MNRIKTYLNSLGRGVRTGILMLAVVFISAGIAQAATTISTDVSTGGTLSVTGASTLTGLTSMIQASSTRLSVFDTAYFGGSATSTFSSAGALTLVGALSGTSGSFSTTLAVTGATTLSASTTVGTATLFAGDDLNRVGVGTTTPLDIFMVEHQTATTTVVISTGAAAKGGRIILEDIDGAGCSEVSALNGTLTAKTVTCPTGI